MIQDDRRGCVAYDAAVAQHKALNHEIVQTFGNTHCRTCYWDAGLTIKSGDPFDINSTRPVVWGFWLNGQPQEV